MRRLLRRLRAGYTAGMFAMVGLLALLGRTSKKPNRRG